MRQLLLIPRIQIHNANAMSSPYIIGFPAMTAWLGGVHALQRRLQQTGFASIKLVRVAVICHELILHTYKGQGDYVYSIIGTANPLNKEATRPSFIAEGRCRLNVSLLIEYEGVGKTEAMNLNPVLKEQLYGFMKFAGGDIEQFEEPQLIVLNGEQSNFRKLIRKLMPGYAIIERRDLMKKTMEKGRDVLDALLDYLTVQHRCQQDENGTIQWTRHKKSPGWIVPLAVGFQGITPLGYAINQRDVSTPHRFAESVVTLGEFRMPFRFSFLDEMFWQSAVDEENDLYLCHQQTNLLSRRNNNEKSYTCSIGTCI